MFREYHKEKQILMINETKINNEREASTNEYIQINPHYADNVMV